MRPLVLLLAAALLLVAPPRLAAQSDAPRVYEMYFQVGFADVPAWIEAHRQREVPLLDSLVAEGTLNGYAFWLHDTGGEYNVRYNFVVANWNGLGALFDAYYARLGADGMEEWLAMVDRHVDQIWMINDGNIPAAVADAPVVYESSFEIDSGQQAQWNEDFAAHGKPALERAMEEGLITGWAELHHDTGGPSTVKYVYWLDSWDATDDAMARIAEIRTELGQEMESGRMIRSHSDNVWRTLPRAGN